MMELGRLITKDFFERGWRLILLMRLDDEGVTIFRRIIILMAIKPGDE
jgi:hypothetical protein